MNREAYDSYGSYVLDPSSLKALQEENAVLREEIRVSRKAAELTANLVAKQFEETEKILYRFQSANAQRKAVLDAAAHISIISTDQEGKIIVFNRGAENLLGYRAEEIIGIKTPVDFMLPSELSQRANLLKLPETDEADSGLDVLFALAAIGHSQQLEWTYVRKNGVEFPVSMSVNALSGPDGSMDGFLCIAMDVTEKKRQEKALRESERKYRLLVRNLPNIVFRGYLDGTIDFFDDKIETLTGYTKEQFLSREKTWFDLVAPEDLQAAKEKFIYALKQHDHSYLREYRCISKNGDVRWIEEGGQVILGEDGEVEYITGAFLDITERKVAERALYESEREYRSLFNSGPNPIFVLDYKTFRILDANPSAEETYGYSRAELLNRSFLELGDFNHQYLQPGFSTLPDGFQSCVVSHRVQHFKKGHKPFFVRVTACPTRYMENDAIILAATDITEMMEKDAQLIQASKMKTLGEMSAGIAHELNQPLNAIKIGNEYLKLVIERGGDLPRDSVLQVAREVSEQVDRASDIINRLREFGRKPDYKPQRIILNQPIRAVLKIIGRQLRLQNIGVRLELDEDLPPILAQNNQLEQVFFNLISNARDAIDQQCAQDTDCPGQITIRTFTQGGRVAAEVSDTGVGIQADQLERVFEPFFTTKEVGKGMGLGLSIVYGIVKEYGGQIEAQNRDPEGTTFKLSFPAAGS